MATKEYYGARVVAANSVSTVSGSHMAGILATDVGTISVADSDGTVLLDAMPVAVGFNRIPILFNSPAGATITLGGGAAGTLLF